MKGSISHHAAAPVAHVQAAGVLDQCLARGLLMDLDPWSLALRFLRIHAAWGAPSGEAGIRTSPSPWLLHSLSQPSPLLPDSSRLSRLHLPPGLAQLQLCPGAGLQICHTGPRG